MATLESAAREAQDKLYPSYGTGSQHPEFVEVKVDEYCTSDALEQQAVLLAADKPVRVEFKGSTGGWTFVVRRRVK